MAPWIGPPTPWMAVVSVRDLELDPVNALGTHAAWVVVVRDTYPVDLPAVLKKSTEADVITLSRRAATARVLPDAVCWRRDTLAVALAAGSSIPATFRLLRRAQRLGARIVDLAVAPAGQGLFGPVRVDAIHQ